MNKEFYKSPTSIGATIAIIGFLLPWVSLGPFISISGYEIPKVTEMLSGIGRSFSLEETNTTGKFYYILYFIPLLSLYLIYCEYNGSKKYVIQAKTAIFLLTAFVVYKLSTFGNGGILEKAGFGLWITFGGSIYLLNQAINDLKAIKRVTSNDIKNQNDEVNDKSSIQTDKNEIYNQLTKLHELKEKGLISDDVFEQERVLLEQKLNPNAAESKIAENSNLENRPSRKTNYLGKLRQFIKTRKRMVVLILSVFIIISICYLIIFEQSNKTNVFPYKVSANLSIDYPDDFGWEVINERPIYKTDEFKEKIGSLSTGERFTMLDDYDLIYQPIIARITNVAQLEKDCGKSDLKVGDEIKLLTSDGESSWSVLHNDTLKHAIFDVDSENKKLINSDFGSCSKIRGDIINSDEKSTSNFKIRTKNQVGWIRLTVEENKKFYFANFIQFNP